MKFLGYMLAANGAFCLLLSWVMGMKALFVKPASPSDSLVISSLGFIQCGVSAMLFKFAEVGR